MRDKRKAPKLAFGTVLKDLRIRKGLTQEKLAFEIGIERSHLSSLERAEKGPSLETILRIATALKISASELMQLVEKRLSEMKR